MFEYFSGNYTWNMAVNTLVEDVGTLSEPSEAFQAVAHLAEANPAVANEAWYQAMVRLGDRLEHMADQDISDGHALSAARKYHRASMYLVRAERIISHEEPKRLATYRRAIANYRKARDLRADGVEFIDIPYRSGYMPALLIRAAGGAIRHLSSFTSRASIRSRRHSSRCCRSTGVEDFPASLSINRARGARSDFTALRRR